MGPDPAASVSPRRPTIRPDSLHPFIARNLTPGATAKTDGWAAYPGAPGVSHGPHVVGKIAAHVVLPWVHRIFSNLKIWALGVYHGLRRKQLQSYLDEFVFRFNRRRTRHAAFRSLLGIAAGQAPRGGRLGLNSVSVPIDGFPTDPFHRLPLRGIA